MLSASTLISSGIAPKNLIKLFFLGTSSSVFHFFKRLITHLGNYEILFYIHQVFCSDSSTRGKKKAKKFVIFIIANDSLSWQKCLPEFSEVFPKLLDAFLKEL